MGQKKKCTFLNRNIIEKLAIYFSGERLHNQIKHLEGEKATLSARSKSDIGSADNYQKEVSDISIFFSPKT